MFFIALTALVLVSLYFWRSLSLRKNLALAVPVEDSEPQLPEKEEKISYIVESARHAHAKATNFDQRLLVEVGGFSQQGEDTCPEHGSGQWADISDTCGSWESSDCGSDPRW